MSQPSDRSNRSATIAACLKWVATRPEIDPLDATVTTDERFSGLSPADLAALEWALRVGEARDLPVIALSLGNAAADTGLRQALANGASSAFRIDIPVPDLDSRAVARGLAAGCREASLVFCGDHSLDRGSGSVPAFLAHELGYGQALGCVRLEGFPEALATDPLIVERRLDQGRRERLSVGENTVLSFEGGLEPRRAGLAATVDSTTAVIPVLACDVAPPDDRPAVSQLARHPYRPRARVLPAPEGSTLDRIHALTGFGEERRASQQLDLEPAAAAEEVVRRLRGWGYLD